MMKILSCLGLKPTVHKAFLLSSVILGFCVSPAYGVQLTFENLDPDPTPPLSNGDLTTGQGATMKFNNVASDNGTALDLIITVVDDYKAQRINDNQVINIDEGQINIANETGTTFEFKLVEAGTSTPFTVSQFDFGLMDIDKQGQEIVTLYTSADYTVSSGANPTQLDIDDTFMDRVEFRSKSGSTAEVPNPTNAANLTAEQQQYAVNFRFYNTSQFYLGYESTFVNPTGAGRNFFFAGDVTFDPNNSVTAYADIPFEFSPGLGLLLAGGGLLGIHCLKKKRRATKSNVVE